MLQFEHFESLTKDGATYPKYSQKVADSAREQTLRTLMDHLVEQNRDYRDIFTSNETFINRALAAVYKVPYLSRQEWARYTFPDDARPFRHPDPDHFPVAVLTPGGSLADQARDQDATRFSCAQPTPEPPADVDFSKVQALDKGTVRNSPPGTQRERGLRRLPPSQRSPGLALEHFDGIGQTAQAREREADRR